MLFVCVDVALGGVKSYFSAEGNMMISGSFDDGFA